MPPTPPANGQITRAEAVQMQTEHIKGQSLYINNAMALLDPGFVDNRDFHFPYDKIEDYVQYVRQYAASNGITISQLGLRVYLGAANRDGGKLCKTHVFFVPTNNGIDMPGVNLLDYGEWGQPPSLFTL